MFYVVLFCSLLPGGAFGQGYTGPGADTRGQGALVTVAEAKSLRDDASVTLRGIIVRSLGRENYVFQDGTGEITVEIDRKVWRDLSVGETDRVEIYGEIDKEWRGAKIDVKTIKKL